MRMLFTDALYALGMPFIGAVGDLLRVKRQVIFCLHSVVARHAPWSSRMAISASLLDQILTELRGLDIDVLSLSSALERLAAGDSKPFACFTFDDGYRDNYANAFPVFLRHEAPFTIFLTTGLVDRSIPMWWHALENVIEKNDTVQLGEDHFSTRSRHEKVFTYQRLDSNFRRLGVDDIHAGVRDLVERNDCDFSFADVFELALDWDMIRRIQASGLGCFGAHTVTHKMLVLQDEGQVRFELEHSRSRIQDETGCAPDFFAYPFGQPHEVGPIAPKIAREAGYAAAFTTVSRPVSHSDLDARFELPRIMLARKCDSTGIVRAYMSGIPAAARALLRKRSEFKNAFGPQAA